MGNVLGVEIGYTHIQQDVEQKAKTDQGEIAAVNFGSQTVLYLCLDTQNIEGLHEQIYRENKNKVGNEGPLQNELLKFTYK